MLPNDSNENNICNQLRYFIFHYRAFSSLMVLSGLHIKEICFYLGMGPMEPVKALCDLGKTIESTTTQINNTKYEDHDVRTKTGSNEYKMNYAANIIQMRELILNSEFCEQYIKFQCKGAALFRSPEGPPAVRKLFECYICFYFHFILH